MVFSSEKKAQRYSLYLLSRRQYSRREIIEKLQKKQYEPSVIAEVIKKLEAWGYLNDTAYAEAVARNLVRFKPQSRSSLLYTLKKHGIDKPLAVTSVEKVLQENTLNEELLALKALARKTRSYSRLPKEKALVRAKNFLCRQGFSYEVINKVLHQNWQDFESE